MIRILLVDDSAPSAQTLIREIAALKDVVSIATVENMSDAIKRIERGEFDLSILDVKLFKHLAETRELLLEQINEARALVGANGK